MKLAVTDANIFIDLVKLKMLGFLFSIELEIYTTQEVIDQLNNGQAEQVMYFVQSKHLNVYKFSEKEIAEIILLNAPRALEFTDKTVVFLAKKINAIVLTGDGPLRKFCASSGLTVRGILWVFDSCLQKEKFNHKIAIEKLKVLLSFNDRLPKEECLKRIEAWEKEV
jgi:hypothetical protein